MGAVRSQVDTIASWILMVFALAVTAPLWLNHSTLPMTVPEPVLVFGGAMVVAVWVLAFFGAVYRGRARFERAKLSIVESRESLIEQPTEDVPEKRVRLTHIPTWALSLLALGIVGALRFWPEAQQIVNGTNSVILSLGATAVIWSLAIDGAISRVRARRFAGRREAVEGRARLAREAIEKMPVMFSVCTPPEGDRSEFNPQYLEAMGQSASDLDGVGWFQCVHETDRQNFTSLFRKGNKKSSGTLKIEYGITTPSGENRWIHELFVPHRTKDGHLVGYLASGFDITRQVENETENSRRIEQLQEESDRYRDESERFSDQVRSLEAKSETLTQSRDRLEAKIAGAEEKVKKAEKQTEVAREETRTVRGDLKAEKAEHTATRAEIRRLTKDNSRLEAEVERLREDAERAKDEAERLADLIEQHKEDANEARQLESQLRTKVNRLTTRGQELEDEMEEMRSALDRAESATEQTRIAAVSHSKDRQQGFADDLRLRVNTVQSLIDRLRSGAASEEQVDDIETTLASVASISAYIDGVLGRSRPTPRTSGDDGRAFDLRAAVRSVGSILEGYADERDVRFHCHVEEQFPTVACGDSARVRETLLLLGTQITRSASDCDIALNLLQSSATSAMLTARIEFVVSGKGLNVERIKSLLAVDDAAGDDLDEQDQFEREQSRVAWELIRSMQGEFGCESNGDGVTFWMDVHFARVRSSRNERPERLATQAKTAPSERPENPRRTHSMAPITQARPAAPRLPQEGLQSNFGPILELGQTSARVKSSKELKGAVKLFIRLSKTEQIELPVEVESCEKLASRHYDAVLHFIEVTEEQKKRLRQIAMTNRRQTTIASSIKLDQ